MPAPQKGGESPVRDAAEDLLAALIGLLPFASIMDTWEDCPYPNVLRERVKAAEVAIAKATS